MASEKAYWCSRLYREVEAYEILFNVATERLNIAVRQLNPKEKQLYESLKKR